MPKKQVEYVTSREGANLLKMDRHRFFYYVDSRNIKVQEGETARKNLYNYEDIMRVRQELGINDIRPTVIDWVGPVDVTSTVALDFQVYHETIVGDLNLYVSWVKQNGRISLAAFDAHDRKIVLAYIALLPLPETVIHEILQGKRNEQDIKPEEIETYEREGSYTLLAESAVTHPDYPEKLGEVIRGLFDYWCSQYPQRTIEKIYAQSASAKGDVLIQKLYFAARYDLAENAFMLDLRRPGASRLVKTYQQCLKEEEI